MPRRRHRISAGAPIPIRGHRAQRRQCRGLASQSAAHRGDVEIRITDDPQAACSEVAEQAGVTAAEVEDSPHYLFGPLPSLRRQLLKRRDRYGLCYYSAAEPDMETLSPLAQVMAGLNAA
jgi:hypothetical protein